MDTVSGEPGQERDRGVCCRIHRALMADAADQFLHYVLDVRALGGHEQPQQVWCVVGRAVGVLKCQAMDSRSASARCSVGMG